jgi:hypothetical protein
MGREEHYYQIVPGGPSQFGAVGDPRFDFNRSAAIWCRADLKQQLNLLARPQAQAAELYWLCHLYWAIDDQRLLRQVLTARQLSELAAATKSFWPAIRPLQAQSRLPCRKPPPRPI